MGTLSDNQFSKIIRNPQFANSLHYRNPYQPSEYVTAISSVGSILADYDYDRNFPVYGFGAKLPPTRQVSHCFPLNGNWSNVSFCDDVIMTSFSLK
jgi:hypothetical protein